MGENSRMVIATLLEEGHAGFGRPIGRDEEGAPVPVKVRKGPICAMPSAGTARDK